MPDSSSPQASTPQSDGRVTLAILGTKLDYLIERVDDVCEHCKEQDKRIDRLEKQAQMTAWIGGAGGAILIATAIAAIRAWLGL